MGKAKKAATAELAAESAEQLTPLSFSGIALFNFTKADRWEKKEAQTGVEVFNRQEDHPHVPAEWCLAVGSQIEAKVSQDFMFEERVLQVAFVANGIWALRFPSKPTYDQFCASFNAKLFHNMTGLEYSDTNKAKVLKADILVNLNAGTETQDSQNQWTEDMDVEDKKTPAEEAKEKKRRSNGRAGLSRQDIIYGLRLGASEHSYLIKNGQIDVLKNVMGGVQDAHTSMNLTPSRGQAFTPSKVLLMNKEHKMIMLNPEAGHQLHATQCLMDIETAKVVSEWVFEKDRVELSVKDIVNDSKSAQMENRDSFLAIGQKRLDRWDLRLPKGKAQELDAPTVLGWEAGNAFKDGDFTCIATSGDGYVAVGTGTGQVRLYGNASASSLNKASTNIPGLGKPITAIDVTYDGKWVIATTDAYIMVLKTVFSKDGKETNAFKARAGDARPQPRLLRLKPEDKAKTDGMALQQGKFTWVTESSRQERWIVAICGIYTVLWNFRIVREAKPDSTAYGGLTCVTKYELIEKPEQVVDSTCMPDRLAHNTRGRDDAMVIITEHKLYSNGNDD